MENNCCFIPVSGPLITTNGVFVDLFRSGLEKKKASDCDSLCLEKTNALGDKYVLLTALM